MKVHKYERNLAKTLSQSHYLRRDELGEKYLKNLKFIIGLIFLDKNIHENYKIIFFGKSLHICNTMLFCEILSKSNYEKLQEI